MIKKKATHRRGETSENHTLTCKSQRALISTTKRPKEVFEKLGKGLEYTFL